MRFPLERGLGGFLKDFEKNIFKNNNPPYPLKKGESPDLEFKHIQATQKSYSIDNI